MLGVTIKVQDKKKQSDGAIMWYCSSVPLLENIQGGTIHQWLWKGVSYPYPVWEEGMPVGLSSGVWDKESGYVTSSYGW